jgi:hypothetical protein
MFTQSAVQSHFGAASGKSCHSAAHPRMKIASHQHTGGISLYSSQHFSELTCLLMVTFLYDLISPR